jgi:ATPase subunit of ABC transporter with duplicated ATPase domains
VLLLDEPSNGLDAASRRYLEALVRHTGLDRVVLFSTHDEEFVMACAATVIEIRSLVAVG